MFGLALLLFASGVDAASRFGLGRAIAPLRRHVRAKFPFISSTQCIPRHLLLSWYTFSS
ncbi:hypothetical protein QQB71_001329 [Salmonella enterica]|nr:hypothetical protein [Salmonella enterica]